MNRLEPSAPEFREAKSLLDEINSLISSYDPVLKEHARDILLRQAFGIGKNGEHATNGSGIQQAQTATTRGATALTLIDYAEKWRPRTGVDRALLGLYYLKQVLGLKSATGRQISKELRESRMRPANISVAMYENVRLRRVQSRPMSGKKGTRQARNEYAITDVGIQYVESRFNLDYST